MRRSDALVYISGEGWDDVAGTNRHLATAIARTQPVLWVDPAVSVVGRRRRRRSGFDDTPTGLSNPVPGLSRLHIGGLPGVTRPLVRTVTQRHLHHRIRRALADLDVACAGVVLTSPITTFPSRLAGRRMLYVTDDWSAGAQMMGFDCNVVKKTLVHNASVADVVTAVSPFLVQTVSRSTTSSSPVVLLPNGCDPVPHSRRFAVDLPPGPSVALVGQLNERLDYDILDAVAQCGVTLVLIGPRTARSDETSRRLDRLIRHPAVRWVGAVPWAQLPSYLDRTNVGITPYVDNAFNRSSFPLKTLEYLAHGLPVVATDLPAARWLNTPHVALASTPGEFAEAVTTLAHRRPEPGAATERRTFASGHSWEARARSVLQLLRTV